MLVLVTLWGGVIPTPKGCHLFHTLPGSDQASFLYYGVEEIPTLFLETYSFYPGHTLDLIFTFIYSWCAYVPSWYVWRTSTTLALHALAHGQRYIASQMKNATHMDAYHME